jgi:quinol monooxygenase YgiN
MKTLSSSFAFMLLIIVLACGRKEAAPAGESVAQPATDTVIKKMITAKVFVKPENVADFLEAAMAMIDSSNAEPGCESYMLYQNPYENTELIFVETWKDQAAIDQHFSMSYFKAFGPKTQDWLSRPTELAIMDVITIQ